MIIITREKRITLSWIKELFSLVNLSEYPQDEMITVKHLDGHHLFCVSFGVLQELRNNATTAQRITNNYEQRRVLIAQQLAAGGNPS